MCGCKRGFCTCLGTKGDILREYAEQNNIPFSNLDLNIDFPSDCVEVSEETKRYEAALAKQIEADKRRSALKLIKGGLCK